MTRRKTAPDHQPEKQAHPPARLPDLVCLCSTARRTARAITQFYADHLRDSGLEPAQLSLLLALEARPGMPQAALGRALALDRTTLSRNLALLRKNNLVALTPPPPGAGRRRLHLTPLGLQRLHQAKPHWERAQQEMRSSLSDSGWNAVFAAFRLATEAARKPATSPAPAIEASHPSP